MTRPLHCFLVASWLWALGCGPRADLGYWREPDGGARAADSGTVPQLGEPPRTDLDPPANASPKPGCARMPGPSCTIDDGVTLPAELSGDPHGTFLQFAGGAELPAGRYRIEYVGGCVRYVSNLFPTASGDSGYTVHATAADTVTGSGAFWLFTADLARVVMTPGTVGVLSGSGSEPYGAFASYAECVTANCALDARDFDFAGGSLSLFKGGIPPSESVIEPLPDQRAPTFRLSSLDECPQKH